MYSTCFKRVWHPVSAKTWPSLCILIAPPSLLARLAGGLRQSVTPTPASPQPLPSFQTPSRSSFILKSTFFIRWNTSSVSAIMARSRSDYASMLFFFLLLCGPEAKPIPDPQYPTRETVDVSKYIDLGRWLEAASSGKFEWSTGAEEKWVTPGQHRTRPAYPSRSTLPTSISACSSIASSSADGGWLRSSTTLVALVHASS